MTPRSDTGWNLRDHLPLAEVTVQSHRGAGVLRPENTLAAFIHAWELGTVPEADLSTLRDGTLVAFHDADLQRVLPAAAAEVRARRIADLGWAEASEIDVGAWHGAEWAGLRIPRFAEVLAALLREPGRRIYLDVKAADPEQVAREVLAAGAAGRTILASTDHDLLQRWKRAAPQAATLLWLGGGEERISARLDTVRATGFAGIDQLQVHVNGTADALSPSPGFLAALGRELRDHGVLFQALPWRIADARVLWQLFDLGVASLATDHPDSAMAALRAYYSAGAGG